MPSTTDWDAAMGKDATDEAAIRFLILRQMASLTWSKGGTPDREGFEAGFLAEASLFPSTRPLHPTTPDAFARRMEGLAAHALKSFDEQVLGSRVLVYGRVPLALVAVEACENDADTIRTVEMMLLVKMPAAGRSRCRPGTR